MTKEDIYKIDPYLQNHTFDYTVPQPWLDDLARVTGQYRSGFFVWMYDNKCRMFGRPFAIVPEGWELLANYVHKPNYLLPKGIVKEFEIANEHYLAMR